MILILGKLTGYSTGNDKWDKIGIRNTLILNTGGRGGGGGGGGKGFQKWRATKEVANRMLDSQPPTLCTHPDPTELYILEHLQQHSVWDPAKIFLASKFLLLDNFFTTAPIKLKLGLQSRWETTNSNPLEPIKRFSQSETGSSQKIRFNCV
jgi:hypothetical protein